jgi:hypothetical protein
MLCPTDPDRVVEQTDGLRERMPIASLRAEKWDNY